MLVFFGSVALVTAQRGAAKFDEFGDTCCNDEKARLDNFAVQLQNEPTATGYIIFYGGRGYGYLCGHDGRRLPRRGEAEARASRLKPYITSAWANFDAARIVVVNGGYRERWTAELWIVPAGAEPPAPTPTLKPKDIKFRRGIARKRDYRCEV